MTVSLIEEIDFLKNQPPVSDIERITDVYLHQTDDHEVSLQLQVIITYLQHIIPVYESLKPILRRKIRKIFYSTVGVSNLINQYKLTKNEVYLKFTKELLMDLSLLVSILTSASDKRQELSQVKSLFFGSKIFQTFEGSLALDKYLSLLAQQLIEVCKRDMQSPEYFLSYLSIHPIEAKFTLFNEFFTNQSFQYLISSIQQMNNLQKRTIITKHLLPYLSNFTHVNNMNTVIKIISRLSLDDMDSSIAKYLSESYSVELQQAVSYNLKDKALQFNLLLKLWGNEQYIKSHPIELQEVMTKELVILTNYISKAQLTEISKERVFLNSITSRLSTDEIPKRNLGLVIAKIVTQGEMELEVVDDIKIDKLQDVNVTGPIDFSDLRIVNGMQNMSLSNQKETIQDSDDDSDDDDDSNDNWKQDDSNPVFLKDLITKYSDDKTRSITHLLSHTIQLVRQKRTFKHEIEFYSEELIAVLVGLMNKYEEKHFEELKLNAIVSAIVVNPQIISKVINLLFTGDYSLQQRMIILSAISLSARELRGLDDQMIEKPQASFPTKELPQRKQLVEEVNQTQKIEEIREYEIKKNESDHQHISSGTVIRMSTKLTKPTQEKKPNNFAKIAAKFYYPLANGWIDRIDVGHYNEVFLKHYLQTLDLIIDAAYPCHEYQSMAELHSAIRDNTQNIMV